MLKIYDKSKVKTVSTSSVGVTTHGDDVFEEAIYGGVWFRILNLANVGSTKRAHKHNFDHVHFVSSGSVEVYEVDNTGKESLMGTFKAPDYIKVPKGKAHKVVALEPNTVAICVQPVRDEAGDMVSEFIEPCNKTRL